MLFLNLKILSSFERRKKVRFIDEIVLGFRKIKRGLPLFFVGFLLFILNC